MKQIILNIRKRNQSTSLVGSGAKNALSITSYNCTDVFGLSWITGSLETGQNFSPAVSWIPEKPGKYTATVFVWHGLNNPTALSPTVEFTINVN